LAGIPLNTQRRFSGTHRTKGFAMPYTLPVSSVAATVITGIPSASGDGRKNTIQHAPPYSAIRPPAKNPQPLPSSASLKEKNIIISHVGEKNSSSELIRESPLHSRDNIVRLLENWGIPATQHKRIIAACTETFNPESAFFTDKFLPNLLAQHRVDKYTGDVQYGMTTTTVINAYSHAIGATLHKFAELKADLDTPSLAEKAKIAMDTIRERVPAMAVTVNLIKTQTISYCQDFQALVDINLPRDMKAGGNKEELKVAQEKMVAAMEELVAEHFEDNQAFVSRLHQIETEIQGPLDELTLLKANISSISSDPALDIEISASHYEKFGPAKQYYSTRALLNARDSVNALRKIIRAMRVLRDSIPSDMPPALQQMADDIASNLDQHLEVVIQSNEKATKVFSDLFTAFLNLSKDLKATSNKNDIAKVLNTRSLATTVLIKKINTATRSAANLLEKNTKTAKSLENAINATETRVERLQAYYDTTYAAELGTMAKSLGPLNKRAKKIGVADDTSIKSKIDQVRKDARASNWGAAIGHAGEAKAALEKLEKNVVANEEHHKKFVLEVDSILKSAKQVGQSCERWKLYAENTKINNAMKEIKEIKTARTEKNWIQAWRKLRTLKTDCEKLTSLTEAFAQYDAIDSARQPKLFQGRINAIHAALVKTDQFTAENFQKALEDAYKKQCQVSRETWLNELGFSGEGIIKLGNDCHITVFNNAVANDVETLDVMNLRTDTIIEKLFLLDDVKARVHVTTLVKKGDTTVRHHRYFAPEGRQYSDEVTRLPTAEKKKIMSALDDAHFRMIKHFKSRIETLRNNHGRPSAGKPATTAATASI
jgi:hypothetical protein